MHEAGNLKIFTNEIDGMSLSSLLPYSFGPKDLGMTGNSMNPSEGNLPQFDDAYPLIYHKAVQAASESYSPYAESKSGVAVKVHDGTIYLGSYIENIGFNPSISPLQAALVIMVADGREYSEISEVVLIEGKVAKISQESTTIRLLEGIAPEAIMHVCKMDN